MIRLWLRGILAHHPWRLVGAAVGVALTVGLLAAIGAFIVTASAEMTAQAIAGLPVDWQVQLVPGTDPRQVADAVGEAAPTVALQRVGYADVTGFRAETGGTVQTTAAGKVLGLELAYGDAFPGQIRHLLGTADGVLIAQQTAANLRVGPGDTVTVGRVGLPPVDVRVDGVVALPDEDAMFQAVGVSPSAAPQAPPDNALLLSMARWHELFDLQAAARPDSVRLQLHVRLAHDRLPAGPGAAYVAVQGAEHNLEARIAGGGIVADNLAARLGGAREDALYSGVLFLFLGAPGAILAAILTLSVGASGASRRRREQALLRVRGASTALLMRVAGAEAAVVGSAGLALGLALAAAASALLLGTSALSAATLPWAGAAALLGLVLAAAAVLPPAWHAARRSTVAAARVAVGREGVPLWERLWLDLVMLTAAGTVLWWQAGTGYQVVLAPEGVAQSSVHYEAFLAPLLLWTGASLLALRLWRLLLGRGRGLVGAALRPLAGDLAGVVAASLARQRRRVAQGVVLGILALSFAVSTAVFDTTYEAQARVDAALTNGADVTVTGTATAPASARLAELSILPGVAAAEPMQHRYAYVGSDLQDLYGIDPTRIGRATRMADAYFQGGDAGATLAALAAQRDGVLVSEETVQDFQLQPGDRLNLRLQGASDHQYHVVPFRFVGVAREFPTAPKDSFLVANAAYVAEQTGSPGAEVVLLATDSDAAAVAARAREVVASLPGAKVTAIGETRQLIGSSLTAVDLRGLTRLELGFAVLMAAGAVGLVLALDLAERRRSFALLAALGAKKRQLAAFLWGEGLLVLGGAAAGGGLIGWAVAATLVAMLTGVFDPPPEALAVPWAYLLAVAGAAALAVAAAVLGTLAAARRPAVEALRDG